MNILMALSQREITGAEVYAATLTHELIARGHKVVIVSDTITVHTEAPFIPLAFNQRSLSERLHHVRTLLNIIKQYDIQVVHAHSRASAWSCALACKIARIPLITTTHGRQPVHLSRKIIKAFGEYSICVCENIQTQITRDLGFALDRTILLRNMVDASTFAPQPPRLRCSDEDAQGKIIVSLIGRLSGPKGDVAYEVIKAVLPHPEITLRVIGGHDLPERFQQFTASPQIQFLGYRTDVAELIASSDVIIGAGRVGIEAILSGRPVIAIGEALYEGLVTTETLAAALSSNFGDINDVKETRFHFDRLYTDIKQALQLSRDENSLQELRERVQQEFSLEHIVTAIEKLYSQVYVQFKHYEIPVIMYHRVIASESEKGVHGTYVTAERFREHLAYLKDKGYTTVTFDDLRNNRYKQRFDRGNKWVILTFDDGYEDNYTHALPLLKEFGCKAVIFLMGEATYNSWDADVPEGSAQPSERRFALMTPDKVQEMMAAGIEFGAHTLNHPRLAHIPAAEARRQIVQSKQNLESIYGREFKTFAYPYGDLNEEIKAMVKEAGFDFAVATDSGDVVFDHDLYQIRRIAIFPGNSMHTFKRKVSGWYNFVKIRREQRAKRK